MIYKTKKLYLQKQKRFFKKIYGTNKKPRLSIFRSNKHIYAQIIDDIKGHTFVSINTLQIKEFRNNNFSNTKKAFILGQLLAKEALKREIQTVVFDRNRYNYHGRIKALADGARIEGLKF